MGLVGAEIMQSAMMISTLPADVPEQYQTIGQAWLWRPRGHSQSLESSKLASDSASSTSKTASMKRRNSGARRLPMRKSHSERPLLVYSSSGNRLCDAMATASLQDVALECDAATSSSDSDMSTVSINEMSESDARRLMIVARAEEIMRGKQCVGILDGATCPVCLMDDVDTQLSACGHLLHAKCIKRWIQKSSRCPVCREEVIDVTEAYASPAEVSLRPMEKDRLTHSSDATCLTPDDERDCDDDGFGWFEDFDEFDELNDDYNSGMLFSDRRSLPTFPSVMHTSSSVSSLSSSTAPHMLMNRQLSANFEVCRTFQPLRTGYDTPYQKSRHEWLRSIPSHRHIAAKIQIRSFRIVESKSSGDRHAEYLIELQLDGRVYISKWRRFSEIARFANKLNSDAYRQSLELWAPIEASSRWFNRLELSYLHERCRMLEEFAHALLLECSNAHKLADFVECC